MNRSPDGIEIIVDEYGLQCITWELNYSNGFTERENQFLQNTGGDNIDVLEGSTVYIINKHRVPESFNSGLIDTKSQWALLSRTGMKSLLESEHSTTSTLKIIPLFLFPITLIGMKTLLQIENIILENALILL